MKLVIATPLLPPQVGGPAQYAVELSEALAAKGHVVSTVSFGGVLKHPPVVRHVVFFFSVLKKLQYADALIILDTMSVALPSVLAARLLRKKSIIRTGGDFVWEQYVERTHAKITLTAFYTGSPNLSLKEIFCLWLQKRVIFPLVHIIAFSTVWQRNIWEKPYGLPLKKCIVIENAYAFSIQKKEPDRNSTTVAWIGRDIALKNKDTLVKAINIVRHKHPALEFEAHSSLTHNEVMDVLLRSRCLVIPSLSEVSPNLALESLSLGIPVLLTRECGLYELLKEAVTWVDPLDPEGIAHGLAEIMTEEGYREAREKAESFHPTRTYAAVAEDFMSILP